MIRCSTVAGSTAERGFQAAVLTSTVSISPPLAPPQAPAAERPAAVLRPHQVQLIDEIDRALAAGSRRIMVQAPTGFGKTMVASTIAQRGLAAARRLIFTVPALSLIDQTAEKFYAEGVRGFGVIQANHRMTNFARPVQIASVQFRERFGCWPNGLEHLPPLEPSRATQNWIKSKQIAWAKSQHGRAM